MMRLRAAWRFIALAIYIALASAQTPGLPRNGNLEFRLLPEAVLKGMPHSFIFLLRNKTDHDVRIPVPTYKCGDTFNGSIELNLRFTPKVPGSGSSVGSGCAGDRVNWPPITQRILKWQVLPAGHALVLKIDPKDIKWKIAPSVENPGLTSAPEHTVQQGLRRSWHNDKQPGIYEFWATYSLPFISDTDQNKLEQLGIDFPRGAGGAFLSSAHVTFRKDE
jgi:hypothetical protein